LVFNYVKAFADYKTNFSFSRGVHFQVAKQYEHITPALLKRVWEVDNEKDQVLWEMGNQGGVSGDCFVKVAYDPAFEDATGMVHPGRVRILPLNSAFCFPEWHPHDRDRLLRFKMKYKFWGTSMEGTRAVYTYTEILTDDAIEEYLNDELMDSRPNPLGMIPVVHIPNATVSGSPWGLSDVTDILSLNREFNEKATDISDIINYHAAPVTVITGAKLSNLEKGAKKVWGGLPKDANVFNLENGVSLGGPMEYLDLLKRAMHEITGVPESALGQMQPISNTSGVALAIMYQPMMMAHGRKITVYGAGLAKINEFVLRTLFLFEPDTIFYDEGTEGILQQGQVTGIDPNDPLVYQVSCEWPPPLPVDALIKLNEIQAKMALGLESKRGALRDLGEEFPDEKMQEIFDELVQDAKEQGSLEMLKAHIGSAIFTLTGVPPVGMEVPPQEATSQSPDADSASQMPPAVTNVDFAGLSTDATAQMMSEIVTRAYGTKAPQRRNPDNDTKE
jgi:hypothetical protein